MSTKLPEPTVDIEDTVRAELPRFIERLNEFRRREFDRMNFSSFQPCEIGKGRKYVSIVFQNENGGRSYMAVFCFVRLADGAILKSQGRRPALNHIRGYIFAKDVSKSCTMWGAKYMDNVFGDVSMR